MKTQLLQLSILLMCFTLFFNELKASHGAAFQIEYKHISGLTYQVCVKFYRDITGITSPASVQIGYTSSCNNGGQVNVNKTSSSPSQPFPCTGTTTGGVEENVYCTTITLPVKCKDWRFYLDNPCCRPTNDNMNASNFYIDAFLNNVDAPLNSSPSFNNPVAVRDFCTGFKQFFDQSVTEINGDSLSYRLVAAQELYNVPVNYIFPYTATNQIPVTGMNFNPVTQSFSFTPTIPFVGTFCFMIEEWNTVLDSVLQGGIWVYTNKPVKVGHLIREMRMVFASSCIPQDPKPTGVTDANGNTVYDNSLGTPYPYIDLKCGVDSAIISIADPLACGSVEPKGSDFLITNVSNGVSNPLITSAYPDCQNGKATDVIVKFPGIGPGLYFLIIKRGNDQNTLVSDCGKEIPEYRDTVLLKVDSTSSFPLTNKTICYPTQPYPVLDLGSNSSNQQWSYNGQPISGGQSIIADTSGTYSVTFNQFGCPGSGSVTVTINYDPIIDFPDTIFRCSPFTPFYLNTGYNNGEVHQWQVIVGGNPINITGSGDSAQISFPNRKYNLTITTPQGCTYNETFWVALTDSMKFQLYATDTIICETETATIQPTSFIPNVTNYNWSLDGVGFPNLNSPQITYSQSGVYKLEVTTDDGCKGSNKITVEVHREMIAPEVVCSVSPDGKLIFSWSEVPGAEGYFVSLDGGATFVVSNGATSHTVNDLNQQSVQVKAFNSSACPVGPYAESSECVKELVVPNVISPKQADGKNDKFVIPYLELYQNNYLVIFDRWGRKVYEAQPYKNDWDGGKNSEGTYFYILELNDLENKIFKGNVTILK